MKKLKDMFVPSPTKSITSEEMTKAAKDAFDLAVREAAACYKDEKFKKYREAAGVAAWHQIEIIRSYRNADPTQYALVISSHVERLNAIMTLAEDVERDLKEKLKGGGK